MFGWLKGDEFEGGQTAKYIPTYASEYTTPPMSVPSTPRETGLPEVEGEVAKVKPVKGDTLFKYSNLLCESRGFLGNASTPSKLHFLRLGSLSRCIMYSNAPRSLRPSPLSRCLLASKITHPLYNDVPLRPSQRTAPASLGKS